MRAVLLAAGEGKRLRPYAKRPKPLIRLLGLSLIERNILALRECGIKEFVVITGCDAGQIQAYLGNGEKYNVAINYLHNPEWRMGNGVSAYTFRKDYSQDEKYVLMMADHLFDLDLLKTFVAAADSIGADELLLAADRRLEKVYDLAECTKIKADANNALKLGKNLRDYNAVDCGLFIGTGALLAALASSIARGHYALTDAVNVLAEASKVKLHFINKTWVDVDDRDSYKQAQKLLLQSLLPAKDGFISRVINRKFSLKITKYLARTGLVPNHITLLSFVTAVAAAFCFAAMQPLGGGLLAQLSSIFDGVDGEIARLKFRKSNYGAIFDALLDRYADFFIVAGMTYCCYGTTGHPLVLLAGAAALTGLPMSMLFKEKYQALTGQTFVPEIHDGIFQYLPANRDGRLFIIMLGGIFNLLPATLVFLAAITHLQTFCRLYKARKFLK